MDSLVKDSGANVAVLAPILKATSETGSIWIRAVVRGCSLAQRCLDALIGYDYNGPVPRHAYCVYHEGSVESVLSTGNAKGEE